jgi:hypothetical protein
VQNAARYITAGLVAGLRARDVTLFFLALQSGTRTIALKTGIGILLWSASNLLYLTLTGQWGREFVVGRACESVCGRSVCYAVYGVFAAPRQYYLAVVVDGVAIAEARAEKPSEGGFWAVLEPVSVAQGDVAVECAGPFCYVNVTAREVSETPTSSGCALVEEKLWRCSWKTTVAAAANSQKIFPVERWLLSSSTGTRCPWTPPEPGVDRQLAELVERLRRQLDEESKYTPVQRYATVRVEVASGCGGVAVLPRWSYLARRYVTVPVGAEVHLHARPCDGCSLLRWEVSDGQSAWAATGHFLRLAVDRNLTVRAYFTDPPKQPKLVLRAESSDGAPVYVNVSGWVLWRDHRGIIYNTTLPSDVIIGGLDFTLRHDTPLGFRVTANRTAVWIGVPLWYGSYAVTLRGPCSYCYLQEGLPTLSGLHLLLVWARGSGGYARVDSGQVHFNDYYGTCRVVHGTGAAKRALGYCTYAGTYNYNNQRPTVALSDAYSDAEVTYRVGRKTQLKFLRWELRGPEGVILRWYGTEAYLPAWYNSASYRWEGVFYPLYSKPDATYELVAVYGPPEATLTARVYAVLPDGSRVYLPSVRVNATTAGVSASAATDGSGVAQLRLPTGGPVTLSFPRVVGYAPYRLVVENVTYNGARSRALEHSGGATSVTLPTFDRDGAVEIAYRAVAPLVVSWGPGGSVQPGFRQVANGTAVYAEDGMPVALVTVPASGYGFSRWLIVERSWAGQPVSRSGAPWNGVLWVDTRYTGAWRVDALFDFEPFHSHVRTNVNLHVEAIDAQGRVRTLASRSLWLQYSGRQRVTLSWTGVLYNEWLRIRLTSDNSVTIHLMRLNATPAALVLARENVTASRRVMYMEAWTLRRYEGVVRIAANASADVQRYPWYKWRLTVVAVTPDRRERVLATTDWITGDKGTSASLTWTGALSDEWVKFVVENDQGSVMETLSAYVEPQLPANATVLYRWPVQLKAEFARG